MPPHPCPTCERTLSTERGMRQHHTKVHGEPLPNRTCGDCGEWFYDPKARRTYCEDCYTGAGEQNGNWKGAKESATCRRCGDPFEYYPSDKEGVFCPDCVDDAEEFLGTPSYELRDVPRLDRQCEQCGEQFRILASAVKRDPRRGRFCSHDCRSVWMSENWKGSNHHRWLEGNPVYAGAWWDVRDRALERDDYECQQCGAGPEEIGQNPDVHHVVPIRSFDDPQDAHRLDNVVCLCRACHSKVEAGSLPCPDI